MAGALEFLKLWTKKCPLAAQTLELASQVMELNFKVGFPVIIQHKWGEYPIIRPTTFVQYEQQFSNLLFIKTDTSILDNGGLDFGPAASEVPTVGTEEELDGPAKSNVEESEKENDEANTWDHAGQEDEGNGYDEIMFWDL